MYSRWTSVAVVGLWVAAMSWLVFEKVLPPLLVGQPPNYGTIVEARKGRPLVGWRMSSSGEPIGWALSRSEEQEHGLTEIRSRVHFDRLPLRQLIPGWLRAPLEFALEPAAKLELDVETVFTIDPLQRLSRFDSALRFEPLTQVTRLKGSVEGNKLKLVLTSGDVYYSDDYFLPSKALISDSLTPQTHLPDLQLGQSWGVPIFSPLRPPSDPLENLEAKVEGTDSIPFDGGTENCWLVVYRKDPGAALGKQRSDARGKLWVRKDGTVLQQQVKIQNVSIVFTLLSEDAAAELEERVGDRNWTIGGVHKTVEGRRTAAGDSDD